MKRQVVPAETPWASDLCYSRAIRAGSVVALSQTSAADQNGTVHGGEDPYLQATHALNNVETALRAVGATLSDVIRTRIYLAQLTDWKYVARAHKERFRDVQPTVCLIEARMVSPEILVEFEVDAIVDE